jgi:outer membrane protein TolC
MSKLWIAQRRTILSKAAAAFALLFAFAFTSEPARTQDKPAGNQTSSSMATADIPISPIEQAEKDGIVYRLSLKDLTKLALQNNLAIAISDTNEELQVKRVLQAYGPYDPSVSLRLGYQSNLSPNTNRVNQSTGSANSSSNLIWNFSVGQNISTGGGIQFSVNSSRQDTNQLFSLFNPIYQSSATLSFTQPLFRNRRIDQNRATIKIYNLDVKISDSQFKQAVTNTIGSVQGAYWDLVFAIRYYDIAKASVRLAQITVNNNREKVRIGVLAPIEITVAQADMASRMVDLVNARKGIMVAENNLRSMISSDRNAEVWHKIVVPTDSVDFVDYKMDLDQAIETALAKRPELEQIELQIQENDVNNTVAINQKKWVVDFQGSFGYTGVAGPNSNIPELAGGLATAYNTLFTQGFRNWYTGLNLTIPLRNRTLESQLGQLQIQKKNYLLNRRNTEQNVTVQIRNAFQDLETNKQNVDTTRISRELAKAQLEGEEKRFQAGMSENFLVLQRQAQLATAEGQELQALVAYKKSIIALQQAMYTLLDSTDFEIAGSGSANPPKFK